MPTSTMMTTMMRKSYRRRPRRRAAPRLRPRLCVSFRLSFTEVAAVGGTGLVASASTPVNGASRGEHRVGLVISLAPDVAYGSLVHLSGPGRGVHPDPPPRGVRDVTRRAR